MITLSRESSRAARRQHLTVPFDLPSTNFVHTARLHVNDQNILQRSTISGVAVDQPLPMRLEISHTTQWDADLKPDSEASTRDFYYEVHSSPDTWLIGGQRKARFSAKVYLFAFARVELY